MTKAEAEKYKITLSKLSSFGVLRECKDLYERQTNDFCKYGDVLFDTNHKIMLFDAFCIDNDYKEFFITPIKYYIKGNEENDKIRD